MKNSGIVYIKEIEKCRVCGSNNLVPILSLGTQYAVDFPEANEKEANKGPLEIVMCDKKNGGCGLLQLKHTLERDILYRKYWYRSGMSTSMVAALADIVNAAEKIVPLRSGDIVIDIGANDGTTLKQYKDSGITRVGFEPSNLWESAKEDKGLTIVHDYFNYGSFTKLFKDKKARIITSIAMFYDLDDPNTFVEDVKKCLASDGLWIIQMNYLGLMLEKNTFDNICHEHLEYYSLLALEYLLNRHEMEVFDVELNDVNGGSFRVYIRHKGANVKAPVGATERLQKQRDYEKKLGVESVDTYMRFADRINGIKRDLVNLLEKEKKGGKRVFIYGASTRGLVVLQFAGIDNKLIQYATDKSSEKWGRYIVGTNIKIISLDEYRKEKPDYLFVLPYHFINEIRKQESEFLRNGGKMIVAIPGVKVYSE